MKVDYQKILNLVQLRIDDAEEAAEYGIDSLPALVYFDKRIPNIYSGDMETVDILMWMTEQVKIL